MSKKKKEKSKVKTENVKPSNDTSGSPQHKDTSPKVYQREKIAFPLTIRERDDWTEKQKAFNELIQDKETKVVFLQGCAGVAKTYLSVYNGLKLLNSHRISDIIYIRSVVESASRSLGFLPGEQDEKMAPFLMPLMDKIDELLPGNDIKRLMAEDRIKGVPVNYLRGASMNAQYIIVDEAQNLDVKELTTVLTRLGKYSKMIVLGDAMQSDLPPNKSGFMKFFDLFNDESSREQGIHCVSFGKEDIVRSGIMKYIVERIETGNLTQNTP